MKLVTAFYLKVDPHTEQHLGSVLFYIDTDVGRVIDAIRQHNIATFRRYCITIEDVDEDEVLRRLNAYSQK